MNYLVDGAWNTGLELHSADGKMTCLCINFFNFLLSRFKYSTHGGWKQFPVLSKSHSLMGHCNHSLLGDVKIVVSTNCPIISEQVAVNFVAQ